jgi:hypothetical protein
MTIDCKFCLNKATCLFVSKLPECPAFSRHTCGQCRRYTSFEDFGRGLCDIEGRHCTIYASDPAYEHFAPEGR